MGKKQLNINVDEEFYNVLLQLKEQYQMETENELINFMLQGAAYAVTKDKKRLYRYANDRKELYDDILQQGKYGQEDAKWTKSYFMKLIRLLEQY